MKLAIFMIDGGGMLLAAMWVSYTWYFKILTTPIHTIAKILYFPNVEQKGWILSQPSLYYL